MAREKDNGWLQWVPEECIPISKWVYCLLGLVWPALHLFYSRRLLGQNTDYGKKK